MTQAIATPSRTKEILKKYNIKIKKKMGQNFLIDPNILDIIVEAANLEKTDLLIEIGPGIGGLTERLLESLEKGYLIAIEKDEKLAKILKELFDDPRLEIVIKDVRDIIWDSFLKRRKQNKYQASVVANLPYYITTPIIMSLLEDDYNFSRFVFMVQKEVAERMTAEAGTKEYGALSVAVQYYSRVEIIHEVPPTVFIPKPGVNSSIIKLKTYSKAPFSLKNKEFFFAVVQAIFQQRRKNIKNALSKAANIDLEKDSVIFSLKQCNIDPRRRGEKLPPARIAELSNKLWENKNSDKSW